MADHTFYAKRELCYTDVSCFTDIQGIGSDPMYLRYNNVNSVVRMAVPTEYQHFLSVPSYNEDNGHISWYIDEWTEHPIKLSDLSGEKRKKYEAIKNDTVRKFREAAEKLSGEDLKILGSAIKYLDDDRIYCADDKVFLVAWGMTPDTKRHTVIGQIIHEYYPNYRLTFSPGEHGRLADKIFGIVEKSKGTTISQDDLPKIICDEGWELTGWEPSPVGLEVTCDNTFTAQYNMVEKPVVVPEPPVPLKEPEDIFYNCKFVAGEHGKLNGAGQIQKAANTRLTTSEIPSVLPNKGYKFKGWDISPLNCLVDGDKTFHAQYEKTIPWYKRFWLWLTRLFAGKGCLKWLLWILLFLLCLWLLSHLLRSCGACSHRHPVNGVVPVDTIRRSDGKVIDDNGAVRPITGDDGKLPDGDMIVAPVMGEGGEEPPIIEQPGMPDIIANRLFLFMENENDDVESLAKDFKKAYPGDQYSIIGFDKEVKLLVIQVPENERAHIRETINAKIPNHKFIVFDEEIYELNGKISDSGTKDIGWHLSAIHLKQGWAYTQGSPDIKVAIVDDGIQSSHPMFKGRITEAYNVFTQNNSLSVGDGHGTHTAGLAAGSDDYYDNGASGVAPKCKIMPVQVFDNKRCPLSALVSGVMYAVHHDADVVNISIGPSFKGLSVLPVEQQGEIANSQFKNVAFLWARVCKLAAKKNCILVFAAGNDDILTSIPPENRNESSIVVTAVDKRMYPTEFTNYGPCSDISAPGKDIYSSYPTSTFQCLDGTSMAAPIVTGTIALMKTIKKDLTVEQARNALYSTGADVYGWIPPMVIVDKALEATKNGDFKRVERETHPIPDNDDNLNSGQIPVDDIVDVGVVTNPQPTPQNPGDETDYDAIRRKIAEYEQKIRQLKKLLPKN
ncbi:MAG: S8 family serine peptidase [Prevotella sp.]|nr:S8 family serine peptidase [Prevotella sp.]